MSQYINKHRRHFAGIALPIFFLFILGAIGISVFPGWVTPTYGDPGTPCTAFNDTACNRCNLEVCNVTLGVCCDGNGVGNCDPTDPPGQTPACPDNLPGSFCNDPYCFTSCIESFNQTFETFICQPNDQFCDDISGGTQSNDCRTAQCSATSFDQNDPSAPGGCEYFFDSNLGPDCRRCEPPVDNCGNGLCEEDEGEDFSTCSLDCRVPGFTGPALDPTDPADKAVLDNACPDITPQLGFVVFPGPVFNDPACTNFCEDGDICTDNVCNVDGQGQGVCDVSAKLCDDTNSDFCCPSGCAETDTSGSCTGITNCDLDCLPPEPCVIPTPTPLIQNVCLEGSGDLLGGEGNGLAPVPAFCDTCSLNMNVPHGGILGWALGIGFMLIPGGIQWIRRRMS